MNYKKSTTLLRGVSVNFYAGTKRAKHATADDELSVSVNYSKDFTTDIKTITLNETLQTNINNDTNNTFYTKNKEDEGAHNSMNYKKGTTLLRGDSVNVYADTKRAKDATADDELSVSVNY